MKFKIIFLFIIFFGLGFYYLVHNGFYPVAIVNSHWISARTFKREYQTALIYYQNAIKTYTGQDLAIQQRPDFVKELRRAALDKLIENTLIYSELEIRIGKELSEIVEKKIPSFQESAISLYGLESAEFKDLVLAPQAQREILEGQLASEKKNFDEWLAKARQTAKVRLLATGVVWDGVQVVMRD